MTGCKEGNPALLIKSGDPGLVATHQLNNQIIKQFMEDWHSINGMRGCKGQPP